MNPNVEYFQLIILCIHLSITCMILYVEENLELALIDSQMHNHVHAIMLEGNMRQKGEAVCSGKLIITPLHLHMANGCLLLLLLLCMMDPAGRPLICKCLTLCKIYK